MFVSLLSEHFSSQCSSLITVPFIHFFMFVHLCLHFSIPDFFAFPWVIFISALLFFIPILPSNLLFTFSCAHTHAYAAQPQACRDRQKIKTLYNAPWAMPRMVTPARIWLTSRRAFPCQDTHASPPWTVSNRPIKKAFEVSLTTLEWPPKGFTKDFGGVSTQGF